MSKIPPSDIVGVTAILLTCSYNGTQEFFRVGYYVNNAYGEEYPDLIENPPAYPDVAKLNRHILVEKPRVTRFQIHWDEDDNQNVGIAPQLDGQYMQQPEMMPDGTQIHVRNDMMSNANLQDAANNFRQN